MNNNFSLPAYIYIICKAVLHRDPAKKDYDKAVKAIQQYNHLAYQMFEENMLELVAKEVHKKKIEEEVKEFKKAALEERRKNENQNKANNRK